MCIFFRNFVANYCGYAMNGLIRHIFSILIMLLLCTTVHASYTPETVPHPRKTDARALVSNPDGILTADEQAAIQQVAQQLYENSGVEMVTVVLGDIGHADAFDFGAAKKFRGFA